MAWYYPKNKIKGLIFICIVVLFTYILRETAFARGLDTTGAHNTLSLYINNHLAFENVLEDNGKYYVALKDFAEVLNLELQYDNLDNASVYLSVRDSIKKNYSNCPYRVPDMSLLLSKNKNLYYERNLLGAYVIINNKIEYIDIKLACPKMGYEIIFSKDRVDIKTNDFKNISSNNKIKLVVLPTYLEKTYYYSSAVDLEGQFYNNFVTMLNNMYGNTYDIITIDSYLSKKRRTKQYDAALKDLKNAVTESNLMSNLRTGTTQKVNLYDKNLQWQECSGSISEYAAQVLNDIKESEGALGVLYTKIKQSKSMNYLNSFYFTVSGFCYIDKDTLVSLNNDYFDYKYLRFNNYSLYSNNKNKMMPIYHKNGYAYYIIPTGEFNDFEIGDYVEYGEEYDEKYNERDTKVTLLSRNSSRKKIVGERHIIFNEKVMTKEDYAVGYQIGQALAAIDEKVANMTNALRYSLLSNIENEKDTVALRNLVTASSSGFNRKLMYTKIAERLLKAELYEEAAKVIKANKIVLDHMPQYLYMTAEEAYKDKNYKKAEELYKKLVSNYSYSGNLAKVKEINVKLSEVYEIMGKEFESKKDLKNAVDSYKKALALIEKETDRYKGLHLKIAQNYENMEALREAYQWFKTYVEEFTGDYALESKVHELAVKLKIDDLTEKRALSVIGKKLGSHDKEYYIKDIDNNGFKDIIAIDKNDAIIMVYDNGDYNVKQKITKSLEEYFDDIDKDGLPEIVAKEKVFALSNLISNEAFMEKVKYRKLFSKEIFYNEYYLKDLKTKEAAIMKFFHAASTKNETELNNYPKKLKSYIMNNGFHKSMPILSPSNTKDDHNTLTINIENNKYDKKVIFLLERDVQGYKLLDIKKEEENHENWFN